MTIDLQSSSRRPLIGGNWKMHLLQREAATYCRQFVAALGEPQADVVLFPSAILLPAVADTLRGSAVAWGGQDLHPQEKGAHTGDTSGAQLADLECGWVLCGHSERRHNHGEGSDLVGEKAAAAVRHGVTPLICVGETKEEREQGRTMAVLQEQLDAALRHRPEPFALAYEPVWAIGTGETATPEIAQEAHAFLRETMADLVGAEAAAARRILYGGSVTPDNAAEIFAENDIDGFLVGGASLDPERFLAIIRCCGAAA